MTNWQGQNYNPRGSWQIVKRTPTPFGVEEEEETTETVEGEIVDDEVFEQLALQAEFQENVYEAYTETGLPQCDQSFDQIVNDMVGDLPW